MKIQKLTIDENELSQAVEAFLKTKGVNLPIEEVKKDYSYSKTYNVTFKEEPIFPAKVSSEDGTNEIEITRLPPAIPDQKPQKF